MSFLTESLISSKSQTRVFGIIRFLIVRDAVDDLASFGSLWARAFCCIVVVANTIIFEGIDLKRNFESEGIILKTSPLGEIHAIVWILLKDLGLIQTIAHGARSKTGKLRSSVQVFNSGKFWLYHDPVKNSYKIQDLMISNERSVLKADYAKIVIASIWLEMFLHSTMARQSEYGFLDAYLNSIEEAEKNRSRVLFCAFLFDFLRDHGIGFVQTDLLVQKASFSPNDLVVVDIAKPQISISDSATEGASPRFAYWIKAYLDGASVDQLPEILANDAFYIICQCLRVVEVHLGIGSKAFSQLKPELL